jgi:hypothetical protein
LRDLANSNVSLGDLSVQLAGRSCATDARRHFDEAKQWYESAPAALNVVEANTPGTKSDGEELDRIHKKLASLRGNTRAPQPPSHK